MSWENLLKDNKTAIVARLEEGMLPGYSVRIQEGAWRTYLQIHVSKFPSLRNKAFQITALHNESHRIPAKTDDVAEWINFVGDIQAAVVGLDLFLREVNRNNDFDKIDRDNDRMVLTGEKIKIRFTLSKSCDSIIMDPDEDMRAEMCLSYTVDENTPVSGDSWLAIYLVSKMLIDADLDDVKKLTDNGTLPDVLFSAMSAVIEEDVQSKCHNCESIIQEGESQCQVCEYFVEEEDTSTVTVHEGERAFVHVYPIGWECPYAHSGDDFINYESKCPEHECSPASGGPASGFNIGGYHLARIDCYLVNDPDQLITNPDRGFSSYNLGDAKNIFDHSDLLLDFFDVYNVEDAARELDMVAEELPLGGWKIDTGTHLLRYDGEDVVEYNPADEEEE